MRHLPNQTIAALSLTILAVIWSLACGPIALVSPTATPTAFPPATPTPAAAPVTHGSAKWSITPLTAQDILYQGEQRVWSFDASSEGITLLSMEAHIDWSNLAGAANLLELTVNENPIIGEMLINKPGVYNYADGQSEAYYRLRGESTSQFLWTVFYSPDYESNNVRGSGYQVLEGQACLYLFDITQLVQPGQGNKITLSNRGEPEQRVTKRPIPLMLRQIKLLKNY